MPIEMPMPMTMVLSYFSSLFSSHFLSHSLCSSQNGLLIFQTILSINLLSLMFPMLGILFLHILASLAPLYPIGLVYVYLLTVRLPWATYLKCWFEISTLTISSITVYFLHSTYYNLCIYYFAYLSVCLTCNSSS